jgi:hypothetical protein
MFRSKLLTGFVLVSVLGVGALAGTAYSSIPANHQLKISASHDAKRLMVQESSLAITTSSTSFVNFTADSIVVPANGSYRVLVTVSGESACDATSWCTMEILVDGVQTNPKSGSDFAFDSPGGNAWTSNSMQGTSDLITGTGVARSVTIDVEWAVVGGGSWRMDDWTVSAQLWKV